MHVSPCNTVLVLNVSVNSKSVKTEGFMHIVWNLVSVPQKSNTAICSRTVSKKGCQ